MTFGYIHPQSVWLYEDWWNADLDSRIIETLLQYKERHHFVGTDVPYPAIEKLLLDINEYVGSQVTIRQIKQRIAFLHQRYNTFKKIASLNETHWNREEKIVTAEEHIWMKLFEVCEALTSRHFLLSSRLSIALCKYWILAGRFLCESLLLQGRTRIPKALQLVRAWRSEARKERHYHRK